MILIDGVEHNCIDSTDRGFQYGDGLFETIEISNGRPIFLKAHLDRLSDGGRRLAIPIPDRTRLEAEAYLLAANQQDGVLKIIVTRGSGGRGYCPPENPAARRVLSTYPSPNHAADLKRRGIHAVFCTARLGHNRALAGIKHLNRLEQVLARREWHDTDIQEGVMLDQAGYVVEGTMSNIFFVEAGSLYTPKLHLCGVAGIVRDMVIDFAEKNGISVRVVRVRPERLLCADEAFFTNSLIGVWPVSRLADRRYPVGPVGRRIADWLEDRKTQDLNVR